MWHDLGPYVSSQLKIWKLHLDIIPIYYGRSLQAMILRFRIFGIL